MAAAATGDGLVGFGGRDGSGIGPRAANSVMAASRPTVFAVTQNRHAQPLVWVG